MIQELDITKHYKLNKNVLSEYVKQGFKIKAVDNKVLAIRNINLDRLQTRLKRLGDLK